LYYSLVSKDLSFADKWVASVFNLSITASYALSIPFSARPSITKLTPVDLGVNKVHFLCSYKSH